MSIPPLPPSSSNYPQFSSNGPNDPMVQELHDLWTNWWNDPDLQTAEKLLDFLKANENYFELLTKDKPSPFPVNTPFSHYYEAAINSLQAWIQNGCDPANKTFVSEWISDVYKWVSYRPT